MDVKLEPARDRRATVENLFQFYVHDFADFWETRRVEFGEDGRFPDYPPLAAYWTEPDAEPFLIRADGNIAGFVLLDRHTHTDQPCDFNMGEFFVSRLYRREGVGRAAALQAITARKGLWEIAVARANTGALAFWRGVASAVSPQVAELDQNDDRWNGAILRVAVG